MVVWGKGRGSWGRGSWGGGKVTLDGWWVGGMRGLP